ncbi:LPS export ABC transporter periplasmic protein LptC [Flavisphingomonas formosensis]|uniref:LPS export ABC transporter periplasmic protein LptC n=1 Tax=Flavisphingomonas formosensis TaxID=861534 RepID=UPI0012F9A736|nr:LPS export ABC transporter periplasmic protein LptC [Sphingomonas formosensis]
MSDAAERNRIGRQQWAAPGSQHDRVIRIAQIVLPTAIVILIVMLAIAPITSGRDISFMLSKDHVAVARERLRVSDALYRGEDTKGQPFALRAESAVQQTSRDPVVKLSNLSARIMLNDGPANIVAGKGRYNMTTEQVLIDGPVKLQTQGGYLLNTHDVTVDMKTRHVTSGAPVDGLMPLGTFQAGRMQADLTNRIVVLDQRARLHIVQGQSRGRP